MEIGKIPENVLDRSIIKALHTKRPEVIVGPGIGEDCAALCLADDEELVVSTDPITGTSTDIGNLAINVTVNDLASAGAEPIGVMVTLLLTPRTREAKLKKIMEQIDSACNEYNLQVIGGHTEVTDAVNKPVISITGLGKVKKGKMISTGGAKPGMDIVVSKWIGLEGTSIIAKDYAKQLQTKLPSTLIEKAAGFDTYLSVLKEAMIAVDHGVAAMHDITEGGIFGAIWEMGKASGCGMDIDIKKIPIKQETIEICEFYDINPYELISSGSMLMAVADGNGLVKALTDAGINAAVIGKATEGNDRVLHYDGETRFLEPPKSDALYLVADRTDKEE